MARALLIVLGIIILVAVYPLIASLVTPWRLVSTTKPVSLGHGATYVTKHVKGPVETELHLVFFDTKSCDLRVAEQPVKKDARSLEEFAHASGAIAACNGGYFDAPNFLPSGRQIVNRKPQGELVREPHWGCVLVRAGVAELMPMEEFKDETGVTDLLQCTPMCVMNGRAIRIGEDQRNRRTFVLTDQAGRWAIGTCKSVGIQELADLLATPGIITELTVKRALNLDGGPSTGLWWKDDSGVAHYEKESWRVKNMLLITPKK